MKALKLFASTATFALLVGVGGVSAQTAPPAAIVEEVVGTARAFPISATGAAATSGRVLRKGDYVDKGETISTGEKSRIQLIFEDGHLVALSQSTSLSINSYVYNRSDADKSNVTLSLEKGVIRQATGRIGIARPRAVMYEVGNDTQVGSGTRADFFLGRDGKIIFGKTLYGTVYVYPPSTTEGGAKTAAVSMGGNVVGMLLPLVMNVSASGFPLRLAAASSNPLLQNKLWWFGTPNPTPPPSRYISQTEPLADLPGWMRPSYGWFTDNNIQTCVLGLSNSTVGTVGPYGTATTSFSTKGC